MQVSVLCFMFYFFLPSTFSLSLMCCRLHPVSSLLSSDSWWNDSSLEWAFLRSLGLADTQQEVVLPIFFPLYPPWRLRGVGLCVCSILLLLFFVFLFIAETMGLQIPPSPAGHHRSPEPMDPVNRRCPRTGCHFTSG